MKTYGELWAVFLSLVLIAFGLLFYLARKGDMWAVGVFVAVWTIICVLIGAAIVGAVVIRMQSKQQEDFMLNTRENWAIVQQQQRAQNMIADGTLRQLKQSEQIRLMQPTSEAAAGLILDNDIDFYSELD